MINFRRKGLIYKYEGGLKWAGSHTYLPTPYVMTDRVRVYLSFWDANKIGRIGYVDLDRGDLTKVIGISDKPILDVGKTGSFDSYGVSPSQVYYEDGQLNLLYIGWQLTKSPPYMLFSGKAELIGNKVISRGIFLDRTNDEPYSRGAPFKCGDYIYYWNLEEWHWFQKYNRYWYSSSIKCYNQHDRKYIYTCLSPVGDEFCLGRPWVIRKDNYYHMWYSYKDWSEPRSYYTGYAYSRNGVSWLRRPFSLVGRKGKWESEMSCHAAVIELDDKLIMFYIGNNFGGEGFGYAEGKV